MVLGEKFSLYAEVKPLFYCLNMLPFSHPSSGHLKFVFPVEPFVTHFPISYIFVALFNALGRAKRLTDIRILFQNIKRAWSDYRFNIHFFPTLYSYELDFQVYCITWNIQEKGKSISRQCALDVKLFFMFSFKFKHIHRRKSVMKSRGWGSWMAS